MYSRRMQTEGFIDTKVGQESVHIYIQGIIVYTNKVLQNSIHLNICISICTSIHAYTYIYIQGIII